MAAESAYSVMYPLLKGQGHIIITKPLKKAAPMQESRHQGDL